MNRPVWERENMSAKNVGEADELQSIMDDYNENFGTSFTTENFRAYYDDINLRMKRRKRK